MMLKINRSVFTLLLLLAGLVSCSEDPQSLLDAKINTSLRGDNKIGQQEWTAIATYVLNNKNAFPDLVKDNMVAQQELRTYILGVCSRRRSAGQEPEIFTPSSRESSGAIPVVNVFIENSGSMDGYVRGNTSFEAALSDLLVQLQYRYGAENLHINFVNTRIYPSELKEIETFVTALEPGKGPYNTGNRGTSKLNEILAMILDSTGKGNISVLASDCIYSLDKKQDTEGALEYEKSLTKGAFLEKCKAFNLSTVILKMESDFSGNYWDKNNHKQYLDHQPRPYYLWILGATDLVQQTMKNINLGTLKGFRNSYTLYGTTAEQQPFYTVLNETHKHGDFKPAERGATVVRSIRDISFREGKLQLALAIDLSGVPAESAYLLDRGNYTLSPGFVIGSIEPLDRNNIAPRDFVRLEKTTATHIITLSATARAGVHDLELGLNNRIPAWVSAGSSTDDTQIQEQLHKTFGLMQLVQGVSEAYDVHYPGRKYYFRVSVTIKN